MKVIIDYFLYVIFLITYVIEIKLVINLLNYFALVNLIDFYYQYIN